MVTELTKETFKKFVEDNKSVIVDCWAPWCGPCRRMGPIVDDLAKDLEGKVAVGKLDTDQAQEIAFQFGIEAIPTLLFFKGGQLVGKSVGLKTKEDVMVYVNQFGL